jgi:hypothetical protein
MFQYRDLVTQNQDLEVLVSIAHGKEDAASRTYSTPSSRQVVTAQPVIMPRRPARGGRSLLRQMTKLDIPRSRAS